MVEIHPDMRQNIDSVRDFIREAKMKLKNAAMLRNKTILKPKLDNDTLWSGKCEVLRRFELLRNDLVEASQHSDCNLTVNDSPLFANKVGKYSRMLKEVVDVTMSLQTDEHSLADFRDDLDTLIEAVRDEERTPSSLFTTPDSVQST